MKNERIHRLDGFRWHDVLKLLEGDSNISVELDKRALRMTGWFGTAPRSARFVEQLSQID